MTDVEISTDGTTITVTIPMSFKIRGGRKLIVAPDGMHLSPSPRPQADSTLVKALARAFRWSEMLECGDFATVSEIARAEKMNISYVSHVLRLALLAPDLVEAILDGRQPPTMQLQPLMRQGFPIEWQKQREFFSGTTR
ncbi:hypothetical protein [Aquamicrobium terrae]